MPTIQSLLAVDLAELIARDMPAECVLAGTKYTVLLGDLVTDEQEAFGGPEFVQLQTVHFKTTDVSQIEVGAPMTVNGKSKVVVSSITSADGNELIVTVRAD